MNPSLYNIIGHTIGTLPDSIKARKALLLDILALVHLAHPLRRTTEEMLQFLEAHEQHQLNLALDFKFAASPLEPKADGDGNGNPKTQ